MRLIGIQALLALLPIREEGVGSASGLGGGIFVAQTSSTAQASGIGRFNIVTAVLESAAASGAGIGAAAAHPPPDPVNDFLSRTSGLDSTHISAYTALINGLVSDGVWSLFDVLYIFATQDSTTALLNLVSSNFTAVSHGPPSFTADRGFTGVDASNTVYIDTGFNPIAATSPNFTTNSCHMSAWADTNNTPSTSGGALGGVSGSAANANVTNFYGRWNDGNNYFRINDASQSGSAGASASSVGHWLVNRSGSSASQGYKNGSLLSSPNAAAGVIQNKNILFLAFNGPTVPAGGTACQVTMGSIGGSLNATQASNFYSRLRTYMTAVGVP